jgi:hypothetical protein
MMPGYADKRYSGTMPRSASVTQVKAVHRRWLCNKHKISNTGTRCFPYEYLHGTLGLVKLESLAHSFPRAKV